MTKYNINTISFLIASFIDVINKFGKNNKSVDFYKSQVSKLIAIGQISTQDAKIVEEIVGMQNTSAVKWDIAEHKLNSFINAMNEVIGYVSQEDIMFVAEKLVAQKIITEQIASIIYKLYGILRLVQVYHKENKIH